MASSVYEKRQADKKLTRQYRQAASRLYGVDVQFGEVKRMTGGAFVEIVIWVPLSEAFCEKVDE